MAIAQCLAQRGDMNPQIGIVDARYPATLAPADPAWSRSGRRARPGRAGSPWRGCPGGRPCRPRAGRRARDQPERSECQRQRRFCTCGPITIGQSPHQIPLGEWSIDHDRGTLSSLPGFALLLQSRGCWSKRQPQYAWLTRDPPQPRSSKSRGLPCVLQRIARIYRVLALICMVNMAQPRHTGERIPKAISAEAHRAFSCALTSLLRRSRAARVSCCALRSNTDRRDAPAAPVNPRRLSPVPAMRCPIERRFRSRPLTVARYLQWPILSHRQEPLGRPGWRRILSR